MNKNSDIQGQVSFCHRNSQWEWKPKWLLAIYICSHILQLSKTDLCADGEVLFPGLDESKHKRACLLRVLREWEQTICFASKKESTLPTLVCTLVVSSIWGRMWWRMDLERTGTKQNLLNIYPCPLELQNTKTGNLWQVSQIDGKNLESLFKISFW